MLSEVAGHRGVFKYFNIVHGTWTEECKQARVLCFGRGVQRVKMWEIQLIYGNRLQHSTILQIGVNIPLHL